MDDAKSPIRDENGLLGELAKSLVVVVLSDDDFSRAANWEADDPLSNAYVVRMGELLFQPNPWDDAKSNKSGMNFPTERRMPSIVVNSIP